MYLCTMLLGEGHVGQHVGFRLVHKRCQLWSLGSDLVGNLTPLGFGGLGGVLGEGGGDECREDSFALLAGVCQGIAMKVTIGNFVLGGVILKQKETLNGPTQRSCYSRRDP